MKRFQEWFKNTFVQKTRIMSMILCACMAVGLAIVGVGCGGGSNQSSACAHVWTEATCTQEKTCTLCGEKEGGFAPHAGVKTNAKGASCTQDGNIEYWTCTCGKVFSDEACQTEITLADTVIGATGHTGVKTEASAASCTQNGNIEYWACACGKLFSDASCTTEISRADTVIMKTQHNATKTQASAATCTQAGNIAYWTCTCGKVFSDEACQTEITIADTVIGATGHDWIDATCEEPKHCSVCPEIVEGLADHVEGTSATCTDPAVCLHCGKPYGTAKGHTEATPATCSQQAVCEDCGKPYGATLPHIYDQCKEEDKFKVNESVATCLEGATYYKSCVCGAKGEETFVGTALAHVYVYTSNDDGTHTRTCANGCDPLTEDCTGGNATCTEKAVCDVCHGAYGAEPAHTWDNGVQTTAPGCVTDGVKTYTCIVCSTDERPVTITESISATGHHHESVVTEPTCSENGYTTYTCPDCGDEYVEPGETATGNHIWDREYTCESDKVCTVCGTTQAKTGHDYQDVAGTHVDATCLSAEKITQKCVHCGDEKVVELTGALGHRQGKLLREEKVANTTCEYRQIYQCVDCDEELEGAIVERHEYKATITKPATCQEDGQKALTCEKCGDIKEGEEEVISHLDENGEVIAQYHKWESVSVNGVITSTCSICQETKTAVDKSTEVSANVSKEELQNGELQLKDAAIRMDSATLEALGDDIHLSAGKLDEDALANAKDKLTEEEKEQLGDNPIYDFKLNGEGANFNGFVTVTIPYTLEEGEDVDSIAVWYMEEIVDEEGKVTYQLKSFSATYSNGYITFQTNHFSYYTVTRLTPAERCALYGHQWRTHKPVAPTCTADGYTLQTCIRCGASQKPEQWIVPATNHNYTAKETPATCAKEGKIVYTCVCSHSYTVVLSVLPHTWKEVSRTEATCMQEGLVTYRCDGCRATYTETLAKISHNIVDTVVSATCTDHGYTLHACTNCEYSYQDALVIALGHDYSYVWNWADDYSSATLTFTCGRTTCNHEAVETAEVTVKTMPGTCTKPSKTEYTATVTFNGGIYTDKKEVVGEGVEHEYGEDYWKYNKHKHWHICKNCHGQQNVGEHTFDEGVVSIPATCQRNGEMLFSCVCGYTYTEQIPATGEHEYNGAWVYDENNHWAACIHCGTQTQAESHTFGAWSVAVPATCTVNGLEERHCEACGKSEAKTIKAIGHNWSEATCTQPKTCVNCLNTLGEALGHKWAAATCSAPKTCGICAATEGSTIAHDYVNGVCSMCGGVTPDCDHTTLTTATIELTEYGICGGTIVYETCECGAVKLFDAYNFEWVCRIEPTSMEQGYDENGNPYQIAEGVCPVCGMKVYGDLRQVTVGCISTIYSVYTFEMNGQTIADNLYYEESWEDHNSQSVSIDLTKFGACGGTLEAAQCADCGEITGLESIRMQCKMSEKDVIFEEEKTETGSYGKQQSTCPKCGVVYLIEQWETVNGCSVEQRARLIVYNKEGEVVFEYSEEYHNNRHEYSETYELLGESCEDGVRVTRGCSRCGEGESYVTYGHTGGGYEEYELAEYGVCGGHVSIKGCLCGENQNVHWDAHCEFTYDKQAYTDVNGVQHTVEIYNCQKCSFNVTIDMYVLEEGCYTNHYRVYTFMVKGETITQASAVDRLENHEREYRYEFENPDAPNCDDGVHIYWNCKHCDASGDYYSKGHEKVFEVEYDLSEYGSCCGKVYVYQCACGNQNEFSWVNEREMKQETSSYTDKEGVEHEVTVYTCYTCAMQVTKDVTKQREGCWITRLCTYTFVYDGTTILTFTATDGREDAHDYVYSYTFANPDNPNCDDGVEVEERCKNCDYYSSYGMGTHGKHLVEEYNLADYGFCGGEVRVMQCPCGRSPYVEWGINCSYENTWEYYTDGNGVEHEVLIYTCKQCAMRVERDGYWEKVGCEQYKYYQYSFFYDGVLIVTAKSTGERWDAHDLEYSYVFPNPDAPNCNDGVQITETCKDCGYSNTYYTNGHDAYNVETYDLTKYGACSGIVYVSECPCGYMKNLSWNDGCGENTWDHYTDDNGIYHDVNTWTCKECALRVVRDSYATPEGCYDVQHSAYTFSYDGEVFLQYETDGERRENHNWENSYVFNNPDTSNCDDGVEITKTCKDCGHSYTYSVSWHETLLVEKFDLSQHGFCEGAYIEFYRCPCGKEQYYNWQNHCEVMGDWSSYEDENGVYHEFETLHCNHCAMQVTQDRYWAKEGCFRKYYNVYTFYYAGETLYEYTYVNGLSVEHSYTYRFEFNNPDAPNCEDGVMMYGTCKVCGETYERQTNGHDTVCLERYDWSGYGDCADGYVALHGCPCGLYKYVNTNNLHGSWTSNQYYDEEGRLIHVDTYSCDTCDLRYTNSYYVVRDRATCKQISYHTILVNVGEDMIASLTYQQQSDSHDFAVTATLDAGADSCEDGVTITYTCKDCLYSDSQHHTYHVTYPLRKIDYTQYGSVCGGYAEETTCACGVVRDINMYDNSLCDFDSQGEAMWIENALTDWYYTTVRGQDYFGYDCWKYVCAVTHPEQCAFTIRYASYWLPVAGECRAQRYVTWQFGYNPETDTCAYEYTYATNESRTYHDCESTSIQEYYENGYSKKWGTRYDCTKCGFYYEHADYYDATGRHMKYEVISENPLNDGMEKLYNYIIEYGHNEKHGQYQSRVYYRTVYADGMEWWCNKVYTYDYTYEAPYGENGYIHKEVSTSSHMGDNYIVERGYTTFNNRERVVYLYCMNNVGTENESWYRYDYTYDDNYDEPYGENGYLYTETYINSDGISWRLEAGYTYLYGYWEEYVTYSYYVEGDYWYRYEYTYSIVNGCERTVVHTSSDGVNETYTESYHRNVYYGHMIKNPTCTQDGLAGEYCTICQHYWNEYTVEPYAHNWMHLWEDNYYCTHCALMSANGASGDIVLEDLTEAFGNGENYVVGYYNRNNVDFLYYVSLILHTPMADGNNEVILDFFDFYEMTEVRAIYFSKDAVEVMALEMGYAVEEYDVRFAFVPLGADGSFDYAITFTEELSDVTHITGSISFVHYVGAGEIVQYTITTDVDSKFVFTSMAAMDSYAYLCDANGNWLFADDDSGENANFRIECLLQAGETYTLYVKWLSSEVYGDMPIIVVSAPTAQ